MAQPLKRAGRLAAVIGAAMILCAGQALPSLTAPVNDVAGVIDPASAAELDRRIRALEASTRDAVVVATVKTFAPYASIEEYAVKLFEQAGIGQRAKDSGVLIVLAQQERRVRIEVGYGLEEFITDGFAGEVIRQQMLPAFREGRFGEGLLAGTSRIIDRISERRGVGPLTPQAPHDQTPEPTPPIAVILLAIFAIAVISHIRRSMMGPPGGRRRRGPWSGWTGGVGPFGGGLNTGGFGGFGGFGGGGGGFGGFGGGRSGGGGASGGW